MHRTHEYAASYYKWLEAVWSLITLLDLHSWQSLSKPKSKNTAVLEDRGIVIVHQLWVEVVECLEQAEKCLQHVTSVSPAEADMLSRMAAVILADARLQNAPRTIDQAQIHEHDVDEDNIVHVDQLADGPLDEFVWWKGCTPSIPLSRWQLTEQSLDQEREVLRFKLTLMHTARPKTQGTPGFLLDLKRSLLKMRQVMRTLHILHLDMTKCKKAGLKNILGGGDQVNMEILVREILLIHHALANQDELKGLQDFDNYLAGWVAWEVYSRVSPKNQPSENVRPRAESKNLRPRDEEAGEAIAQFVSLAASLRHLGDLDGMWSIVMGLQEVSEERLPGAWLAFGQSDLTRINKNEYGQLASLVDEWDAMQVLCAPHFNYGAYRAEMRKMIKANPHLCPVPIMHILEQDEKAYETNTEHSSSLECNQVREEHHEWFVRFIRATMAPEPLKNTSRKGFVTVEEDQLVDFLQHWLLTRPWMPPGGAADLLQNPGITLDIHQNNSDCIDDGEDEEPKCLEDLRNAKIRRSSETECYEDNIGYGVYFDQLRSQLMQQQ